jgi:hypothetical protein
MEVTNQMKEIAMLLAKINGGRPKIGRYYDDNNQSMIDLVIMDNKPGYDEKTYATVGLCNYDIGKIIDEKFLRIEIIGACISEYDCFANIISTCAFNIINSGYKCYPGAIFPDVVKMYYPEMEMKHILFVSPFLWDDNLKTLDFDDKKVTWLQAIPIAEKEYIYAQKHGVEALEDKLEEANIDILDLQRSSVI